MSAICKLYENKNQIKMLSEGTDKRAPISRKIAA